MNNVVTQNMRPIGVISVSGRMDAFTIHKNNILHEQQHIMSQGIKFIVLDLSAVTFLDGRALSTLVSLRRRVENIGGKLVIIQPTRRSARQSLNLARFDRFFDLHETKVQAMSSMYRSRKLAFKANSQALSAQAYQ